MEVQRIPSCERTRLRGDSCTTHTGWSANHMDRRSAKLPGVGGKTGQRRDTGDHSDEAVHRLGPASPKEGAAREEEQKSASGLMQLGLPPTKKANPATEAREKKGQPHRQSEDPPQKHQAIKTRRARVSTQ